jgi:hypothetical protein
LSARDRVPDAIAFVVQVATLHRRQARQRLRMDVGRVAGLAARKSDRGDDNEDSEQSRAHVYHLVQNR